MDYTSFPIQSSAIFVASAAVLRILCVAGWIAFPGHTTIQIATRILIGLGCALALFWINRTFLLRSGFSSSSLGVSFPEVPYLFFGALLAAPILIAMVGAMWLLAPFDWQPGMLPWKDLGRLTAEYFAGNSGEELMFRGYLLLVLRRSVGLAPALFVVSLLFGVFHLPGLSGIAAAKMVCTTAIWSFMFGLAFIRTGSLWTAIGMHVFGNIVLHHVFGTSGRESVLSINFNTPSPAVYDPGFLACVVATVPAIGCLFLWPGMGARRQR
jgi:membrane protease YdiL (CAAX protease family)